MDLKILVFLGSTRASSPPKPARLGLRVARACLSHINSSAVAATLVDPLDYDFGNLFKPHFSYAAGKSPAPMQELADAIEAADGYVMVSPEYNHSMSPALADLLNHFGSSLFSYKPSAIVTYSAGQWGGVRAGVGMRAFLSELGCLPVSAMVHVPKAQGVFEEDGRYLDAIDAEAWTAYAGRAFDQLLWWASAAKSARAAATARAMPAAFKKDPAQRNAP